MSYGEISKKYNISRPSIQYIIRNYCKIYKKRGPKEKLTKNDKRRIKTLITGQYERHVKCSISDIIKDFQLNVSKATVCRTMKCLKFKYERLPHKFYLTCRMRQRRVDAARAFLRSGINWNQVIFSDEKMFTVQGSHCYYAWLNRNMSRRRVRQVVRSPGLMVWAMVMPNGLLSYKIMKGRQKSENYIRVLENNAIPIIKLNYKDEFTFQQDNCPIHVSRKCQEFFRQCNIKVLDWPPYSPDLNIMENIWGFLSNDIYSKGSIKNLRHLQSRLQDAITSFNENQSMYVRNLYDSIITRLCLILEKHGQRLKY